MRASRASKPRSPRSPGTQDPAPDRATARVSTSSTGGGRVRCLWLRGFEARRWRASHLSHRGPAALRIAVRNWPQAPLAWSHDHHGGCHHDRPDPHRRAGRPARDAREAPRAVPRDHAGHDRRAGAHPLDRQRAHARRPDQARRGHREAVGGVHHRRPGRRPRRRLGEHRLEQPARRGPRVRRRVPDDRGRDPRAAARRLRGRRGADRRAARHHRPRRAPAAAGGAVVRARARAGRRGGCSSTSSRRPRSTRATPTSSARPSTARSRWAADAPIELGSCALSAAPCIGLRHTTRQQTPARRPSTQGTESRVPVPAPYAGLRHTTPPTGPAAPAMGLSAGRGSAAAPGRGRPGGPARPWSPPPTPAGCGRGGRAWRPSAGCPRARRGRSRCCC